MTILNTTDLSTEFRTDDGTIEAVSGLDISIREGETVGIVGESGSGKSVTALSIMGLIDTPGYVTDGHIDFKGEDLRTASEQRLEQLRGNEISMIFQDPMEGLNPVLRVGDQVAETLRVHRVISDEGISWLEKSVVGNFIPQRAPWKRYPEAWDRAIELMEEVGIPEAEERAKEYPHQFSGGMLQRSMIAQALAGEPDLLIADEPTTALDVTIEAQILDLIDELQEHHGMSVLLITHDLGVIVETCDRVAVMYAGEIVEVSTVEELFSDPKHPYTQGLMQSIPDIHQDGQELKPLEGQVPDLIDMPDACYFAPRCKHAHDRCFEGRPPSYDVADPPGHKVRCVLYDEDNPRSPPDEKPVDDSVEKEAATSLSPPDTGSDQADGSQSDTGGTRRD